MTFRGVGADSRSAFSFGARLICINSFSTLCWVGGVGRMVSDFKTRVDPSAASSTVSLMVSYVGGIVTSSVSAS